MYADVFAGINWTAAGLHRIDPSNNATTDGSRQGGWRLTFPPPSIHIDATPGVIRDWYEKQWEVEDYRNFVEGWYEGTTDQSQSRAPNKVRPLIFGTVDDHDYGQNNGDATYQYKR